MSNYGYVSFRPLSGYLISKYNAHAFERYDNLKFPSPLGVSYFQIAAKYWKDLKNDLFPSPLGVSYFQIVCSATGWNVIILVSVPSRGILFPNVVCILVT